MYYPNTVLVGVCKHSFIRFQKIFLKIVVLWSRSWRCRYSSTRGTARRTCSSGWATRAPTASSPTSSRASCSSSCSASCSSSASSCCSAASAGCAPGSRSQPSKLVLVRLWLHLRLSLLRRRTLHPGSCLPVQLRSPLRLRAGHARSTWVGECETCAFWAINQYCCAVQCGAKYVSASIFVTEPTHSSSREIFVQTGPSHKSWTSAYVIYSLILISISRTTERVSWFISLKVLVYIKKVIRSPIEAEIISSLKPIWWTY